LLTEAQVQKSFTELVHRSELTEDVFERAEELLEQLRPESPLRHRLQSELHELRQLVAAR
jgi:hypothetical protein